MAKEGLKPHIGQATDSTPAPPKHLALSFIQLPQGQVLHRVHQSQYAAHQFNPGMQGNARFSPIRKQSGQAIPTLYAGTTLACALMETVFHDVAHTAGFKSYDKAKLRGQVHSTIHTMASLQLVDLSSIALRKLGVSRKQLIDTEKDQYPATRRWAEAIHRQCVETQGLCWISRQDDSARALILFGDRIAEGCLQAQEIARSLTEDSSTYDAVLGLAERIGAAIVPGGS